MMVYRTEDMYGSPIPKKLVLSTPFKELWVPTGGPPNSVASNADKVGNTLLAYIKGNQYIHVGDGIMRILIKQSVEGFYSELSENDIPEPYIYTTKSVIIINEGMVYPKSIFLDNPGKAELETRKAGIGKKLDMKRIRTSVPE